MRKYYVATLVAALLCGGSVTLSVQAEEKIEVKQKSDGSWKMKIKRKNDKEWEGVHEGRTYTLRGDAFTTVRDDGDYTVYGTMAPDNTYITSSRVERVEIPARETVRETVTTRPVSDGSWRMRVSRRGDNYVGVYGGKTYVLRGDTVRDIRDEGDYTVYGAIAPDDTYITTTKITRYEAR